MLLSIVHKKNGVDWIQGTSAGRETLDAAPFHKRLQPSPAKEKSAANCFLRILFGRLSRLLISLTSVIIPL